MSDYINAGPNWNFDGICCIKYTLPVKGYMVQSAVFVINDL